MARSCSALAYQCCVLQMVQDPTVLTLQMAKVGCCLANGVDDHAIDHGTRTTVSCEFDQRALHNASTDDKDLIIVYLCIN